MVRPEGRRRTAAKAHSRRFGPLGRQAALGSATTLAGVRALVTGGAGFIGSNLAHRLITDGHDVRVLDDLSTGYEENVPSEADLIEANVADETEVKKAMQDIDVVFHQAAHRAVLRSVEHPLETDTANTHGTLTVLQAAREAGVRRFVSASSSSVS